MRCKIIVPKIGESEDSENKTGTLWINCGYEACSTFPASSCVPLIWILYTEIFRPHTKIREK